MDEREITSEILSVLQSMDLFKGRVRDELTEWLGKAPFEGGAECMLRSHAPGAVVYAEGDFGNSFYIMIRGRVIGTLGPEAFELFQLSTGAFFGEVALISGRPRGFTMRTLEASLIIEVPRRVFELWMRKTGPFRDVMDQSYAEPGHPEFAQFKQALTGGTASADYEQAATALRITPAAAKQAVYRLRRRYRQLFRQQVARTVETDADVDDEIGRLLEVLAE